MDSINFHDQIIILKSYYKCVSICLLRNWLFWIDREHKLLLISRSPIDIQHAADEFFGTNVCVITLIQFHSDHTPIIPCLLNSVSFSNKTNGRVYCKVSLLARHPGNTDTIWLLLAKCIIIQRHISFLNVIPPSHLPYNYVLCKVWPGFIPSVACECFYSFSMSQTLGLKSTFCL